MPVAYPANTPTSGITSLSWTNSTSSTISRSPFSFQGQAQSYGGAIRLAQVTVEGLNRQDAEDWVGFLDSLQGTLGTFLLGDPLADAPMGVGTGTPVVNGANQTGDTLSIRGVTPSTALWYRRGDWLQLGSAANSRLYKTTSAASSNASGIVVLNIWPRLRRTPIDGEFMYRNYPKGLFRRSSGNFNYTEDNGCKTSLSFDCEEVI